jgi:hypothetical protein
VSFTAASQTPFLPTSESTRKADLFTGFTEDQLGFYFCGGRELGGSSGSGDSVSGFCIRTNSSGRVLQRLNLNGFMGSHSIRLDGVQVKDNRVYITGGIAYPKSLTSRVTYNKIMVLCLDTNLNYLASDTFSYLQNDSAAMTPLKTIFLHNQMVMGYNAAPSYSSSVVNSFLTVYDYNLNRLRHQVIDSLYLAQPPLGNQNEFLGITKHSDSSFVVSISPNNGNDFYIPLLIDTALRIIERTDSFGSRAYLPSAWSVHYRSPVFNYCPAVRHPSGAYFFGPVISTDSGDRIGLSKINNIHDTVRTRAVLPGYYYQRALESLPAFKTGVQLLRNQRELVVLGSSLFMHPYQQSPSYIRVGKYDTALNLLWHRAISKANTVFIVVGIYELQNTNLMVLASAYDYTINPTASTAYDMYAFILDSTGTPLSTFTVPAPASSAVTLYPNPSHQVIRFSLPASVTSASYRLTDLQGRTIRSGTYASGNEISVAALPPANYLYQVHTADGVLHSGMFTKE